MFFQTKGKTYVFFFNVKMFNLLNTFKIFIDSLMLTHSLLSFVFRTSSLSRSVFKQNLTVPQPSQRLDLISVQLASILTPFNSSSVPSVLLKVWFAFHHIETKAFNYQLHSFPAHTFKMNLQSLGKYEIYLFIIQIITFHFHFLHDEQLFHNSIKIES